MTFAASLRLTLLALAPASLALLFAACGVSGCGRRQVGGSSDAATTPATPVIPAPVVKPLVEPADGQPPASATATQATVGAAAAAASTAPTAAELAGDYECRFTRGDRELAPVSCAIRTGADGALRLEQAGGNIRVSGTVTADEAGFRLSGEVTCVSGPCPAAGTRELVFFSQSRTAYSAVVSLRNGAFLNIDLARKN